MLEETLNYNKQEVVKTLISKYEMPGLSPFVGNILRLYTKSNKLVDAFLNFDLLGSLVKLIANLDFNI